MKYKSWFAFTNELTLDFYKANALDTIYEVALLISYNYF